MKAALVGRHQLLKIQEEVIRRAGLEIIKQIPQIPNEPQQLQQFIQQLKQENVQALVIQALPPQLIAQLLPHFQIFSLKMEAVAVTESLQEAQKIVNEKPEKRVILQGKVGEKQIYRISEFKGLYKIKEIRIVEEPVVTV